MLHVKLLPTTLKTGTFTSWTRFSSQGVPRERQASHDSKANPSPSYPTIETGRRDSY